MGKQPDKTPEPWERQPGETNKAYDAFCAYRNLPTKTRSLAHLVRNQGKSKWMLEKWSSDNQWVQRVGAYDDHIAEQARQAHLQEQKEAIKRHNQLANAMIGKAAEKLLSLNTNDMTSADIARFADTAVKIQRQALEIQDLASKTEISGPDGGPIQISPAQTEEIRDRIISRLHNLQEALEEGDTGPIPPGSTNP